MILYFDIETLPTSDPEVVSNLHASVKPPGTLKKAESIDAWWKEDGEKAKADAVAKTSFDGMYGRIACICAAVDDGDPVALFDEDEAMMLLKFNRLLFDAAKIEAHKLDLSAPIQFCGHNIAGFDLPFLKHRSIINQVEPHPALLKAMNAKQWDPCIADTMLMWSADREKRASMDKLCRAFGIAGKGDFDGSMVAATWPTDPVRVIDYCCDDVRRTREIYKRITFQF